VQSGSQRLVNGTGTARMWEGIKGMN